jgi:predicted dehydrogenase
MIRVAVAGLGRVGAQNDVTAVAGAMPRSHVGAMVANPGLQIVALIDPDREACEAVLRRWPILRSAQILGSLDELGQNAADVITVAGPTDSRAHDVITAVGKKPRVLVVEKPFAGSLADGRKLATAAQRAGVALRVNFPRRFDPRHVAVRAHLSGVPRQVVFRYSKGLRNYASHAIDLLLDWFGAVREVQSFGRARDDEDPNVNFRCGMAAGFDVVLIGINGLEYDQFEFAFYFQDRCIELANGGVEMQVCRAMNGLYYPGYAQLGTALPLSPAQPVGGLREFYQAVVEHLTTGARLGGCDEKSALAGLAVIDAALASLVAGGKAIGPEAV